MAAPDLHPLSLFLSLLLLLLSYPSPSSSTRCHKDDKRALLAIKSFWGNPSVLDNWGTTPACCNWSWIWCDDTTGRVSSLSIQENAVINGTIPPAVGDLSFLEGLNFHDLPNLVGPIIPALSRLTRLTSLTLRNNGLSGPIPSFLATSMPNLRDIDLSSNRFTGPVHPEFSSIRQLHYLNLVDNQLIGSIPDSFGKFPPDFILYLGGNGFTGPLPKSMGAVNFYALDLSRNKLSGDASFVFNSSLVYHIDISRNEFEFDLSEVQFPQTLRWLSISFNGIYGRIPQQIAELPNLSALNVTYNRLCGKIPTGGTLGQFDRSSYAHNKCLCGTPLPPCK